MTTQPPSSTHTHTHTHKTVYLVMEGGNLRGFNKVEVYEAYLKKRGGDRGVLNLNAHRVKGGYEERVWVLRAQNGERQLVFEVFNNSEEAEGEVRHTHTNKHTHTHTRFHIRVSSDRQT